ncbi:MAG: hypothetical protein K8W52_06355 [Deltaproteobacteria bacterium]|nr:hypothetical protein [Deltaproteobacteria bacterium]
MPVAHRELRTALPRLVDRLRLRDTGLSLSPFCVGITDDPAVIGAAFDAGINAFFVTCDMHWPLYEQTRRGLADLFQRVDRDEVIVAGVAYVTQPEFQAMPFQELVDALPGLERLDVLVAGGAYASDLLPRLPALRDHVAAGRFGARALAASFHDRAAAREAITHDLVDLAFVRFNAAHPKATAELFPHIRQRRGLVYNFTSTGGYVAPARLRSLGVSADHWCPDIVDHYRHALSHRAIDGLLCAPRTLAQLAALAQALERGPLDEGDAEYLEKLCVVDRGDAIPA